METRELLAAYASGNRDFQGADLRGADLRGADLRGANLRDADLRDADLWDAHLRGADLRGADLQGANLRDADLRDADLWDANLRGANLRGADLQGADLWDADLWDANLRGADLQGAKMVSDEPVLGYFTRTRIGSESGELQVAYGSVDVWLKRGCSGWLTPDEFLNRVEQTHGNNHYAQIYRLTVAHIIQVVELERASVNE